MVRSGQNLANRVEWYSDYALEKALNYNVYNTFHMGSEVRTLNGLK